MQQHFDLIPHPVQGGIIYQRPKDGYEVILTVMDLKLNTPDVTAEKFVLNPPPGVQPRILK